MSKTILQSLRTFYRGLNLFIIFCSILIELEDHFGVHHTYSNAMYDQMQKKKISMLGIFITYNIMEPPTISTFVKIELLYVLLDKNGCIFL